MKIKFDLNDLTLENIGSWPIEVRVGLCLIAFIATLFLGYWLDTRNQLNDLGFTQRQEKDLKTSFETKQHSMINFAAYKEQLAEIARRFGTMLRQLPNRTEVPGLLEDLSKAGTTLGLEFKSFDPQEEVLHDFYAELPIKISVIGNYHQFGNFVSNIASLNRIVTLHDFEIRGIAEEEKNKLSNKPGLLVMDITAKTYRYIETPVITGEKLKASTGVIK